MTMDKLFDGSDAHLLPGNAELIQRLRTHACYTAFPKPVSEAADAIEAADKRIAEQAEEISKLRMKHLYTCGTTHPEMYKTELDYANQRIAELEAAIIGWKADQKENMATAVEECKRANEAERKLDVAREALKETTEVLEILRRGHGVDVGSKCYPAINIAREALAQIGVDE